MAVDLSGLLTPGVLPNYSVDGSGNNTSHDQWGSTNEQLLRLAKAEYGDGVSSVAGADRPSPRLISNTLSDQGEEDIISKQNLSAFVYAWGQFIDHDLGLTPTGTTESMSIAIPKGDSSFDPLATGLKVMKTSRSVYDPTTGTSTSNPRQQVNTITAWIDGSMIYGSDKTVSDALRTFQDGKLKIDEEGMLPKNNAANFPNGILTLANDAHRVPNDQLFAAGDVRANENIELTALHTVFVREHNRWADSLKKQNPKLTDEELYQRARALVVAEIQSITYNEWLPALFGSKAVAPYTGYNSSVNPQLSNEFSTAAFRFGHSLLGDDIEFLDNNGRPIAEDISLSDAFFNPIALEDVTIESMFKYLSSDPASELDPMVVGSVRNFLFGPPGAGGFDLASLNIQRGRDHGLADYNDVRAAIGLPRVKTFADITKNKNVQDKLKQLYGTVDKIDLWVGALAEDHLAGSSAGPTVTRMVTEQFQRLRVGDRFYFENNFKGALLTELKNTKLSDILERNTRLRNIQDNVFIFKSSLEGTVFADINSNKLREKNEQGLAGWSVDLVSSEGDIVATTKTNADGRYKFDVQDGVRTDNYSIQITKDPKGIALATPWVKSASVTRGEQFVKNIDFAAAPPTNTSNPKTPPKNHATPHVGPPGQQRDGQQSVVDSSTPTNIRTRDAVPPKSAQTNQQNKVNSSVNAAVASTPKSSPTAKQSLPLSRSELVDQAFKTL